MTEEFHQQIGRLLNSMETNTQLTKEIAHDIGEIKTTMGSYGAQLKNHDVYLDNLNRGIVDDRKALATVKEEMSAMQAVGRLAGTIWGSVWGTVSSIIVVLISYFLSKGT